MMNRKIALTGLRRVGGWVVNGWEVLRKPTTPTHWLFGLLAAFMSYSFGLLYGGVFILTFMYWEHWNDRNELMRKAEKGIPYVYEGDHDWWESALFFCFGMIPIGILQAQHIISIGLLHGN